MESIKVLVKGDSKKPFKHFYNAVGYANADYTYTEPTKKMYNYFSSFTNHFKYMRVHNILTTHGKGDYYFLNHNNDYGNPISFEQGIEGDTLVSMKENGQLFFNWEFVDKIYDIFKEHNIKPIVETIFIPSCIQKSKIEPFLPKEYNLWAEVLMEFVVHVQERYGKEEVEQWYFEVWNEPDNQKYWNNNPETFFALYDYMVKGIHSINPNLKVGGPAVKQGEPGLKIYKAFLEHCTRGVNYATGTFGTHVDFISVHCKGGSLNSYNPSTEVLFNSVEEYVKVLKEYPEFEGIEFFNDESDIVWYGNKGVSYQSWLNFRNTHYFPGFVCKMIHTYCDLVEDQYKVNLSLVDSDNCHLQWERQLFSGNRSQFTPLNEYPSTDLIKKPAFNGYVLLSRLGKERAEVECKEEGYGKKYGVLPTLDGNVFSAMVWNFEDGIEEDVNGRDIHLNIEKVGFSGKYKVLHYRIDKDHSSSYNVWKAMGKPTAPNIEEIKKIREREGLELCEDIKEVEIKDGISFDLHMPMHSVSLLLCVPSTKKSPEIPKWSKAFKETGFNKNPQIFLKWIPNREKDFLYYRIWRKIEGEVEYKVIGDNFSLNTSTYTDMEVEGQCSYFYKVQAVNASMVGSELSEAIEIKGDGNVEGM